MTKEAISKYNKAMITLEKKTPTDIFVFLPILAICIDLFTPLPIWKNILPSSLRWVSHIAVAAMILVSIFRMISFNHIPRSFGLIVAISIIWSYVAVGHGQGITPTIWGVWLLFQFPFVGLFMYLQPNLPRRLPEYLRAFCLIVLGLVVTAQLLQFAFGATPGDNLSGLFGEKGTGNAIHFEILVCCVFFGYWIESRQWIGLLIALSLSMLSSVLGEMKVFAVGIAVIGLMAIFLYTIKYRAPGKMLLYLTLIILIVLSFVFIYNSIIISANESPIQTYITNPTRLLDYLNSTRSSNMGGTIRTDIGRLYAVSYGWNSLQNDPVTFLFGYGIGTRSESQTLGTAGLALTKGDLGFSVGTSLLVMMQEMGTIGLTLLVGFLLWILLALVHDIRACPESLAVDLRYALFLFSILWPLWLFYSTTWTMRVPMLLYWFAMGYVFAESRIKRLQEQSNPRGTIMAGG